MKWEGKLNSMKKRETFDDYWKQTEELSIQKNIWRSEDLTLFSQLVFTCSKLIIETLEQAVKYIQS